MTRLPILALLAGAALAGCKGKEAEAGNVAQEPVVTIGRENLAIAAISRLQSGPAVSGSLEAKQAATLRAQVPGAVLKTFAEAGQPVKRGQLLLRIDDTAVRDAFLSARSGVRTAEASVQVADRNRERAERLAQAGALPERDLEQARWDATSAEGSLADARARLASAQEQLAHTAVRAPFDGIVSERPADAGDVVQLGAALFTIVDPRLLQLEASVPAEAIGRLRLGTPVEFTVNGFDRQFEGRIQRINPVIDATTRQVRVYAEIPNPKRELAAGLFAEGRVATDTKRAVAIPAAAIDSRGTSPVVHRLKGGQVSEVTVQLGVRDEVTEMVEVNAGVAEGDTLLLGSAQGVTPGARVRVLQEEAGR